MFVYWCLMPLSTIFQLYRGGNGGGNQRTRRKPQTCGKSPCDLAMKAPPLVTACQLAKTSRWKTHVNFIRIYIPFPSFTIVNSKLPRRGLEGLYSTSISAKTSDKSAATASALRLNTCQDLLEKKKKKIMRWL